MSAVHAFVPGAPANALNGSHAHWRARAAWARRGRTATADRLRVGIGPGGAGEPTTPKLVVFEPRVWSPFDDDGLRAALKPARDAVGDAGLIDDDSPGGGHVFRYGPVVDRRCRGVAIRVEPQALAARLGQLRHHLEVLAGLTGRCPACAATFPLPDAMPGAPTHNRAPTPALEPVASVPAGPQAPAPERGRRMKIGEDCPRLLVLEGLTLARQTLCETPSHG